MNGPGVRQGASVHSANLLDITPTILTLMGLPAGEDMDGRVLLEALDDLSPVSRITSWDSVEGDAGQHPPELQVDPFESQDALKQLADLGYIQPVGEDVEQALRNIDRETRSNLGVVYLTTRRPHRALPIFERLHAEYPADGRFALNLAHCQHACGRSEQAEQTLKGFQQSNAD